MDFESRSEASVLRELDTNVSEEMKMQWEKKQEELKQKLSLEDADVIKKLLTISDTDQSTSNEGLKEEFYIAGVDISFVKNDNVNACAAIVIVRFPDLQLVYEDCAMVKLTAPYIPGYLAFRECPFILEHLDHLSKKKQFYNPQLIMVDGNGILHPREFGLACHLGVLSDIPCIGVAKKLFQVDGLEKDDRHHAKLRMFVIKAFRERMSCIHFQINNLKKGGDTFPLQGSSGRVLGMVIFKLLQMSWKGFGKIMELHRFKDAGTLNNALRSCDSTHNPVYVSPGHKISLESAVKLVHRCCQHRVPEPIRWADIKSREYIRTNFITMDQENLSEAKKFKSHQKKSGREENEKILKSEKKFTSDDTAPVA